MFYGEALFFEDVNKGIQHVPKCVRVFCVLVPIYATSSDNELWALFQVPVSTTMFELRLVFCIRVLHHTTILLARLVCSELLARTSCTISMSVPSLTTTVNLVHRFGLFGPPTSTAMLSLRIVLLLFSYANGQS